MIVLSLANGSGELQENWLWAWPTGNSIICHTACGPWKRRSVEATIANDSFRSARKMYRMGPTKGDAAAGWTL
jgi:hypothetical protein